jgi:hypothetical protein
MHQHDQRPFSGKRNAQANSADLNEGEIALVVH